MKNEPSTYDLAQAMRTLADAGQTPHQLEPEGVTAVAQLLANGQQKTHIAEAVRSLQQAGLQPLEEPAAIAFTASLIADQYDGNNVAKAILQGTRSAGDMQRRPLYTGVTARRRNADATKRFLTAFKTAMGGTDATRQPSGDQADAEQRLNASVGRAISAARKSPAGRRKTPALAAGHRRESAKA